MVRAQKAAFFTDNLILWDKNHNRREMPWKGEKDPYRIWLSEIILQQTKVEQGMAYYERFIKTFPTAAKLAATPENDVFKLWEGLGYYTRCKNLIASARRIAFDLKGVFPDKYEDILLLKGVGPYTAAAIASFAFDLPYAVTDGNVFRVLARFFGINTPIDTAAGKKEFMGLAQDLLLKTAPGLYNQAIMDFGAVICKPKLPLCSECIFRARCDAFKKNLIGMLPVKSKKPAKKYRVFYYIVAEYKNKVYVRKRTEKDIWQNLWEFILIEMPEHTDMAAFPETPEFRNAVPGKFTVKSISPFFKQQLTHQVIEGCFIYIILHGPLKNGKFTAIDQGDFKKLAFPRAIKRYLENEKWT